MIGETKITCGTVVSVLWALPNLMMLLDAIASSKFAKYNGFFMPWMRKPWDEVAQQTINKTQNARRPNGPGKF